MDDDTRALLTKTLFEVGGQPVRVFFLIKTFLFLTFLHVLSQVAHSSLRHLAPHNRQLDHHRESVLSKVFSFAIYTVGILIWIYVEGINVRTLVVLGGTFGVGVRLVYSLLSVISSLA